MEPRIFHGNISPVDFAQSLMAHFNRGNYRVQQVGGGEKIIVQIATYEGAASGGQTALTITLQKVADGVVVQIGKQDWLGVAASLGFSALAALRNPWELLSRFDDIAQDIQSLQLSDEVWAVLEQTAKTLGAGFELSERLRRLVCDYCNTANPVGEPRCIACGAPLGDAQPFTCPNCGFVLKGSEKFCPNCAQAVAR